MFPGNLGSGLSQDLLGICTCPAFCWSSVRQPVHIFLPLHVSYLLTHLVTPDPEGGGLHTYISLQYFLAFFLVPPGSWRRGQEMLTVAEAVRVTSTPPGAPPSSSCNSSLCLLLTESRQVNLAPKNKCFELATGFGKIFFLATSNSGGAGCSELCEK